MALVSDIPLDEKNYVASLHNMINYIAIEPNILLHEKWSTDVQRTYINFHSLSIFLYGAMKYVENIHTRYSS
jgi:hypothetical protein